MHSFADSSFSITVSYRNPPSQQETVVREALLECMYLIGSAVHPSRLGTEYSFPNRMELIAYVKVRKMQLLLLFFYIHNECLRYCSSASES